MIGTVLSGRYRLEAKLGSGGMSTVYLADDDTLDRPVAVKVMHREMSEQPDQIERFRQEARAVAKISHPNVVSVIDAGEDHGHPYIVFEYVEGETLKQRISRVGALDIQESIAYAIEIARGLSIAHARNLVHRDIKPQNVLIDDEGRAKLTDFGISRQLEQDGMTATGRVLGTTDYVAPEQAMGRAVDPRSDIYSLGVVLYEMLVGQVPFHADSQVGVAMKHVNEELPDVQRRRPEVSAAVALVVERSTAKDPAERYQNVGEMIDDLETALEVEAARAGSTTGEATSVLDAVPPPKRKLSGKGRWSWAAIMHAGAGRRRSAAGDRADRRRDRRRRRQQGQGRVGADHLGDRLRPRRATARRSAARSASRSTATRPAAPGKPSTTTTTPSPGPRAAPTRGRHLRHHRLPGAAEEDDRQEPDRGLGRGGLRRPLGPAGRPRRMGGTGRRDDRRRRHPGDRAQRPAALQVLPALVQQGIRSARPGRPVPGRDQRHLAAGLISQRPPGRRYAFPMWSRVGLVVGLVALALAPTAVAAVRHASPPGSGTACSPAAPCSLRTAVEDAKTGDEVVLASGTYPVPVQFFPPAEVGNLYIHGQLDAPMPRIVGSQAVSPPFFIQGDGSRWNYLEVVNEDNAVNTMHCGDGDVVEHVRLFSKAQSTDGLILAGTCLVRDSLIRVGGDNAAAINARGGDPSVTGHVRNVTAIAGGSDEAVAISAEYVGASGGAYSLDVKNTIAIGGSFDLQAEQSIEGPGHIVITHSNFRSTDQTGTATVSGAPNLGTPPLFLNPAIDDYRLGPGWPTIDAGVADPLLGTLDLAGNPRTLGAAPDIGAFEFVPPPAPVIGQIQSLAVSPKRFRAANAGGAILSAGKKGKAAPLTATVTYALSAGGEVSFSLERAVKGRRVGKGCVKQTPANRAKKRCAYLKPVRGGFAHTGAAGPNRFTLSGRLGAGR